jgi:Ca2+-dependent lipid-binding protein
VVQSGSSMLSPCVIRPDRSSLGFPDPFAVVTVDGEQTHTTSVIRKTLNPYWNESFDMYELTQSRASAEEDVLTGAVAK